MFPNYIAWLVETPVLDGCVAGRGMSPGLVYPSKRRDLPPYWCNFAEKWPQSKFWMHSSRTSSVLRRRCGQWSTRDDIQNMRFPPPRHGPLFVGVFLRCFQGGQGKIKYLTERTWCHTDLSLSWGQNTALIEIFFATVYIGKLVQLTAPLQLHLDSGLSSLTAFYSARTSMLHLWRWTL